MPFPPMPTQVKCPNCGESYIAQIHTIIDVGDSPEMKQAFMKGQVNRAECTHCGTAGMLSSPLVYHDPEKELLISFVPGEMALPADQQEQLVGSLVNAVMNSVPAEERKAYFFTPRTALTMESLYDAILEAEGISKEALQEQRTKLQLVNDLLAAVEDEDRFAELVEEKRDSLDYAFFLLLSDVVEARREEGPEQEAKSVENLREKLLERVSPAMPQVAPQDASYDDVVELLQEAEGGDTWSHTVALNRPRLDYGFFQALTAKVDSAQSGDDEEAAEKLGALRQHILDELDALNQMVRKAEDEASLLIMRLSEAEDMRSAIAEHLEEVNDVFFVVLSRYLRTAESQDDADRVAKLKAIMETTRELLEERLPPDLRLVNRLIRAEHPDETSEVLDEHRGMLTEAFLETFDRYHSDLESADSSELVEHLKKVREQIVAKRTILL